MASNYWDGEAQKINALDNVRLNDVQFKRFFSILDQVGVSSEITFRFIASQDQSSKVRNTGKTSEIWYDIGQALTLKTVYTKLLQGNPTNSLFSLFSASAAYAMNKSDTKYGIKLATTSIEKTCDFAGAFLFDHRKPVLDKYLDKNIIPFWEDTVDASILFHEIFHHLEYTNKKPLEFERYVKNNYDEWVRSACHSDQIYPEFLGDVQKTRKENNQRREYYDKNQKAIKAEIECDIFAYHSTLIYLIKKSAHIFTGQDYLMLFSILFYKVSIVNLEHTAFYKRAKFFHTNGMDSHLPPSIADFNLRRVALAEYIVYIYAISNCSGIEDKTVRAESFNSIKNDAAIELNNFYADIMEDFFMPCIAKLNSRLRILENNYPFTARLNPQVSEDIKKQLFMSQLPNLWDQGVFDRMLKMV